MPDDMIVTPEEQKQRDIAAQNLKAQEVKDATKVLATNPNSPEAQQQVEAAKKDLETGITSKEKPTTPLTDVPLSRVVEALKQAHAKGDVEGAKKLATYLRSVQDHQKSVAEDNKHSSEEYEPPKKPATTWEKVKGAGEAALQFATGAVGGLAGLVAEAGKGASELEGGALGRRIPEKDLDATTAKEKVQSALTYQPRTEKGKEYAKDVATPESLLNPLTYVKAISDTGEALKNQTDDPNAKAAIDVAFNAALSALPKVPGAAVGGAKYLMRGGEESAKKMQENIAMFKRAGVSKPTIGQVSAGGLTKGSYASPGTIERQSPEIADRASKLADQLSAVKTSEEAGKVIKEALQGTPEMETLKIRGKDIQSPTGRTEGGWIKDVKKQEDALHNKWQEAVGLDTPVYLPSTLKTLKDLTTVTPGAEATTAATLNPKIMDIYNRLKDDAGRARSLPLQAVEQVRQSIGALTDPSMEARISAREANALYAALKQDVGEAVARKSPAAKKAYNDAFEYSRNLHDISETIVEPILKTRTPEKAFAAATSGTKEGVSALRTLLEGDKAKGIPGLNPAERDVVKGVMLRKLGESDAGKFNADAFFKNWNTMHEDAKSVLFGKEGGKLRTDLDHLSNIIEKSRSAKSTIYALRDFAMGHGGEGVGGAAAMVMGHRTLGEVLLGGPTIAFVTGRLISNPKFVKWLASASSKKSASLTPMLANLEQRVADEPQSDQEEVKQYINNVENSLKGAGQ